MQKSYKEMLVEELMAQYNAQPAGKDIIIVVHNQLELTKRCLESIFANTLPPFHIYLWDNASDGDTEMYLVNIRQSHPNVTLVRSEENLGFISPNNELAQLGTNPYMILLNNDTEVSSGWDTALLGYLQAHENISAVGFQGGLLSEDGIGVNSNTGTEIDYIMGWCVCFSRELYKEFGLFDHVNLQFAYGEDSDFSLRLREAGKSIYAITMELVKHHAHQTTAAVKVKRNIKPEFVANHEYVHRRWHDYLKENRVLKKYPETEKQIYEAWTNQHKTQLNLQNLVAACL